MEEQDQGQNQEQGQPQAEAAPASPKPPRQFNFQPTFFVTWVGKLLEKIGQLLTPGFFDRNLHWFNKVGHWGVLAAAALGFIFSVVSAIKSSDGTMVLLGLGWILLLLILQYTADRFATAGEKLIASSPSSLASVGYLECVALLTALLGVLGFLVALVGAIQQGDLGQFWSGLGWLVLAVYLTCFALNPQMVNLSITSETSAGQEAIGIVTFFLKSSLKVVPVAFGVGVVVGGINLLIDLINLLRGAPFALFSAQASAGVVVISVALPFISYVLFLIFYLIIDVLLAILKLPRLLSK